MLWRAKLKFKYYSNECEASEEWDGCQGNSVGCGDGAGPRIATYCHVELDEMYRLW